MAVGDRRPKPTGYDVTTPHHPRVYDYVLGGKDNYAVDREAAEKVLAVAPDSRRLALEQRKFLVRVVRFIAESGIRQFIDLGTGIPTSPNVHEVARAVHPTARVAYVDFDPLVVAYNDAVLTTDDGVITILEDIRDPEKIFNNPELRTLIDLSEPVGVLFLAVFHDIADEDDPAGIVARFREQMVPGSYVGIEQFTSDSDPEAKAQLEAVYENSPWPIKFRPRNEVLRFFEGFELLPPGLVDVQWWRPDIATPPLAKLKVAGGVGRKI